MSDVISCGSANIRSARSPIMPASTRAGAFLSGAAAHAFLHPAPHPAGGSWCRSSQRCYALIEKAHDSRPTQETRINPIDAKTGRVNQIVRLSVEMTPARNSPPQRRESVLPASDVGFWRTTVLGKKKLAAGFEYAPNLGKRLFGAADGA